MFSPVSKTARFGSLDLQKPVDDYLNLIRLEMQRQDQALNGKSLSDALLEESRLTGRIRGLELGITFLSSKLVALQSSKQDDQRQLPTLRMDLVNRKADTDKLNAAIAAAQQELDMVTSRLSGPSPDESELVSLREQLRESEQGVLQLEAKMELLQKESSTYSKEVIASKELYLTQRKENLLLSLKQLEARQNRFKESRSDRLNFALDKEEKVLDIMRLQRELAELDDGSNNLATIPEHAPVLIDFDCRDIESQQAELFGIHEELKRASEIQRALNSRISELEHAIKKR